MSLKSAIDARDQKYLADWKQENRERTREAFAQAWLRLSLEDKRDALNELIRTHCLECGYPLERTMHYHDGETCPNCGVKRSEALRKRAG